MRDEVVELARALIARVSVTPEDAGCQALIAERMRACGFQDTVLDREEVRNRLLSHGRGAPHLMLLGHTDVVPSGPETDWTSPPFEPAIRDGKLYGRGAADMKSSVAAFVIALEAFVVSYPDHRGTVSLLLTSDEEGPARHGVRAVAPELEAMDRVPDYCLVGEPSSLKQLGDNLRIGRRGSIQARLRVRGRQGHTAYTTAADNPVHRAAPLLAALAALDFDDGDAHFPPSRLQISNVNAGTGADNVTPGELVVWFNLRNNPNSASDELERRIRTLIAAQDPGEWDLDWRESGAPFGPAAGNFVEVVVAACAARLEMHPVLDTGGGTSDGRFIAPLGTQVVELGPVNASIHQVDEHIAVADLERLPGLYLDILRRVLRTFVG